MSSATLTTTHKRTVEQANDAFVRNDIEAFLNLCTENIEWTMVGDTTVRGKSAVREWMKSMDPGTPAVTVDRIIAEADYAVTWGSLTMKDKHGRAAPFTYGFRARSPGGCASGASKGTSRSTHDQRQNRATLVTPALPIAVSRFIS